MLRLTRKQTLFVFILSAFVLMGYNNCAVVDSPTAESTSFGSSFSHQGITQGCASCHDTGKSFATFPATGHQAISGQDCSACHGTTTWIMANPHAAGAPIPTSCFSCHAGSVPSGPQGSVSLANNLTPSGGLFDHSGNGGTSDCVSCHTAVPENVGVSWAGGVYSHSPQPTSCTGCHTSDQRPVGSVGSPAFNHANGGTGDCVGCHASTPANIGRTWANSGFSHSPTPTACASCHLADANYLAVQNVIKNQMSHGYSGLPDCATCHATPASASSWTSWNNENVANGVSTARGSLGVFHTGFGSTPTYCNTCHTNERPTALVGSPAFDHSTSTAVDCAICHKAVAANVGKTWAGGNFSHAGVTTCIGCHASEKPSGLKGTASIANNLTPSGGLFDHSGNGGSGDCAVCHTSVPANVGVTWAGGVYSHSPQPTSCITCHTSAQRPTGPVGNPAFDHANGGTGDCVGCHAGTPANIGRTWAQAGFSHSPTPTACATCHLSDSLFINVQNIIKNQMSHLVSGLPDCAKCHTTIAVSSGFTSWNAENIANGTVAARTTLGVFHTNYGSTPSTCQNCHSNERPKVLTGTSPAFDHTTYGTGDCVTCHAAAPGLRWSGGQYSHAGVTTCISCHAGEKPAGTVPNTRDGFTHATGFGTECAACHTQVAANVGSSWTKGFFNHAGNSVAGLGNTCSPCHDSKQHHAGQLCTSCHTVGTYVKWPTPSASGSYGGSWGQP